MEFDLNFPRVYGEPCCKGIIRATAEDFQVDENLGFAPSGDGEHLYLQIRKRHQNSQWIAKTLARIAGIRPQDVSYAGLKDRHALTTQWFSLWLPGKADPDWQELINEDVQILTAARHSRKLKRGGHQGNQFRIRLTDLKTTAGLEDRLLAIKAGGVPNYFGEQRFGIDGGNLRSAEQWFSGQIKVKNRQQRGFYLSAARSYLFNLQLAERIRQGAYAKLVAGDCLIEAASTQLIKVTDPLQLQQMLDDFSAHPTALLAGRGRTMATEAALAIEQQALSPYAHWLTQLEKNGLVNERRATRMALKTLHWQLDSNSLLLEFFLPSGCFATSVLREIADYQQGGDSSVADSE